MNELLISADTHITEPADLYTTRLPKHLRERALYIDLHGEYQDYGVPGHSHMTSSRYIDVDGDFIGPDLEQRLKNLEDDGIWGEMMFPNYGLSAFVRDHELAIAHARVYNDFIVERFSEHFDRHKPMALVPLTDIDDAVAEVERVAAMGIQGINVPVMPPQPFNLDVYDPLWAACQANGLIVTFHVGTGFSPEGTESTFAMAKLDEYTKDPHSTRIKFEAVFAASAQPVIQDLVGSGALARFPDLHFIAAEFSAYWLTGLMAGMDKSYTLGIGQWDEWEVGVYDKSRPKDDQPMMFKAFALNESWPYELRPSDYLRRQVHVTFMDDPVAIACRHVTGVESLLWSSDYPHAEGTFPRSSEAIEAQFAGVSEADRTAMLGGTLAKLLNFKEPSCM